MPESRSEPRQTDRWTPPELKSTVCLPLGHSRKTENQAIL